MAGDEEGNGYQSNATLIKGDHSRVSIKYSKVTVKAEGKVSTVFGGRLESYCKEITNWGKRNALTIFLEAIIFMHILFYGSPKECEVIHEFDNGLANCTENPYNTSIGTKCLFTCDERYEIEGNKEATCTEDGKWSSNIPKCIVITCPSISRNDEVINIDCSDGNNADSECVFQCDDSARLSGSSRSVCTRDGYWLPNPPHCDWKKCEAPPASSHTLINCTNSDHRIGTSCETQCLDNHILEEDSGPIVCQNNEKWSRTFPNCICRKCFTGEQCDMSTKWEKAKHFINQYGNFLGVIRSEVYYAGRKIICEVRVAGLSGKWQCSCRDEKKSPALSCKKYESAYGACEHSCAELIRRKADSGEYPQPCDRDSMVTGC